MLVFRIALDALAAVLLVAGLAYWWLGNLAHEVIGTAMFVLIIVHNVFNRRVWSRARSGRYHAERCLSGVIILLMATAMIALLATSIILSRDLIGLKAGANVSTARQMHSLAAYWGLILVALHLGTRWRVVMNSLRNAMGIGAHSHVRAFALRALALGIAIYGAGAFTEMAMGEKLLLVPALDLWDFNEAATRFLFNHLSIMVLIGAFAHYLTAIFARRGQSDVGALAGPP